MLFPHNLALKKPTSPRKSDEKYLDPRELTSLQLDESRRRIKQRSLAQLLSSAAEAAPGPALCATTTRGGRTYTAEEQPERRHNCVCAACGPARAAGALKMSSKLLRHKAQEFLASRRHANNLVDIIGMWEVSSSLRWTSETRGPQSQSSIF